MNMFTTATTFLTKYGKKGLQFVGDKSPELCLISATVNTILTGYLTYKAYKKTREKIQEMEKESPTPVDTKEKVKACYKYWIPPMAACFTSLASSFIGYRIQTKRNASLVAAYTLLEASNQATKDKMNELLGMQKADEITDAVARERISKAIDSNMVEETGRGNTIWYDAYTGHVIRTSQNALEAARNMLNDALLRYDTQTISDFYSYLNLDSEWGFATSHGWDSSVEMMSLRFKGSEELLPDGTPYGVFDYQSKPFNLESRFR